MERTLQDLVWRRANRRCEYCQVAQDDDRLPFEIDHIIGGGLWFTRPELFR